MYIILAILAFGIIIAVHELGHFLTAKALNVKVLEFSIGMGPKLLCKQGRETLYSLRLIPFGGFCSMEGEYGEMPEKDGRDARKRPHNEIAHTDFVLADGVYPERGDRGDDEDERFGYRPPAWMRSGDEDMGPDPRSFIMQKEWKRFVILAAGSVANLLMAFIIIVILSAGAEAFETTTIATVNDGLPHIGISEIMPGDKIISLNGERLYYYNDYAMFASLNADKPVTLVLLRGGERIEYNRRTHDDGGEQVYRYSLTFERVQPTLWETLKFSAYQTFNFLRMIRVSISMMASGTASVTDVAGPVGIVSAMSTAAQESPNVLAAITSIVFFTAFIGVNVAAINLLPIPAMDGGRILFLFITWVFEKTMHRKLDPKYENYINTGAFALLIGLMALIMFNDILQIIKR